MNTQLAGSMTAVLELAREVDDEIASDIAKESVFVSPNIDRIAVDDDRRIATVFLMSSDDLEATVDKASRFLDVMVKQVSGFDVKVFFENTRTDPGPYQEKVNEGFAERGRLHDFGKSFDIHDTDGEPALSGCVGLGIERWVLAAFTQHGFEPERWPADVRNEVFA